MCFFIPLSFGCPTKIKQLEEDKADTRICPNCHNASVVSAKAKTWFEFCFVPLFPFKNKKIWICGVCNWQADHDGQFQPQAPGGARGFTGGGGPPGGGPGGGYNPGYPPATAQHGGKV